MPAMLPRAFHGPNWAPRDVGRAHCGAVPDVPWRSSAEIKAQSTRISGSHRY
jgi:hypothetical protein